MEQGRGGSLGKNIFNYKDTFFKNSNFERNPMVLNSPLNRL